MKKKRIIAVGIIIALITAGSWYYYEKYHSKNNDIVLYGNIDIRDVQLSFRVNGRIQKMDVDEGDKVKKGDVIAELDADPYMSKLKEAQGNIKALQADLTTAERGRTNYKTLYEKKAGTKERYDRAVDQVDLLNAKIDTAKATEQLAQINLEDTKLVAPSDGIILTRVQEPGAIVAIGQAVYDMAVENPIWARAYVTEQDLGRVYPGMKAIITTDSGSTYNGHVGFISPQAEFTPKTVETSQLRTDLVYRLRVVIDDSQPGIQQGMPVTIKLIPKQ